MEGVLNAKENAVLQNAENITVGFAVTGSYCTFSKVIAAAENLTKYVNIVPIFSNNSAETDTRFGKSADFKKRMEEICERGVIEKISDAEPIGPKKMLDALVIAPCTGNTIAKLANGIADTTVTLAAKSQLRNLRPVIIAVSTNDGLGANAANIGRLMARKNIYFVPFGQDDCVNKENSLVADFEMIPQTIECALGGRQIQPLLLQRSGG